MNHLGVLGFGGGVIGPKGEVPSALEAHAKFGVASISNYGWEEGGGERMMKLSFEKKLKEEEKGGGGVEGLRWPSARKFATAK